MNLLKTYNNLFNEIISFENLYAAYLAAKKGKRYKPEVLLAGSNIEAILSELHYELSTGTWRPDKYREFLSVTEVKRRIIHAPTFKDRILQHAIVQVIRPYFEEKFIYDSYAVTPGKGTHLAVRRVQNFLRRAAITGESVYVLQCDISKFYPSMDHDVLKSQIRRTIRDKKVLRLLDTMIDGFNGNAGKGLPIGALTSQLAANIYLNVLDHFVKECIGAKYYLRYMDDFIIIDNDKQKLKSILADIRWLVECHLKLKLNPKTQIYPASRGVDFAGYRTFTTHILPRKRNIKAAKLRFKDLSYKFKWGRINIADATLRVISFLGYTKHCQARETTISTLKWLKLRRANT